MKLLGLALVGSWRGESDPRGAKYVVSRSPSPPLSGTSKLTEFLGVGFGLLMFPVYFIEFRELF
jgi:hypothetical protein